MLISAKQSLARSSVFVSWNLTQRVRVMSTQSPDSSSISIFNTVASFREWREDARRLGKSVGFVATMGALHQGHLSLVEHSLRANDLTVVSIFVNPAQFAPHEDLDSYPRTLSTDLAKLSELQVVKSSSIVADASPQMVDAIFAPSITEMYPNGIERTASSQKGTFVEVRGYSHQMEGTRRPDFFRGVATVVTKLFHIIEPTNTYFGQKDIQQALLLRRLCADLLFSYPKPQNLHIVPTARAPSGLALSSRNTYLSDVELGFATTLYEALMEGGKAWKAGLGHDGVIKRATEVVDNKRDQADALKVEVKLDYVEMNDPETFEIVAGDMGGSLVILSGALWLGRTRLIDNILLGDHSKVLS
ncbi:Pantoate-beta-alanine ligase [Ramaria rubella]|nr:Pantoate-beta-alanine ligase [Ramaria rubella]